MMSAMMSAIMSTCEGGFVPIDSLSAHDQGAACWLLPLDKISPSFPWDAAFFTAHRLTVNGSL